MVKFYKDKKSSYIHDKYDDEDGFAEGIEVGPVGPVGPTGPTGPTGPSPVNSGIAERQSKEQEKPQQNTTGVTKVEPQQKAEVVPNKPKPKVYYVSLFCELGKIQFG